MAEITTLAELLTRLHEDHRDLLEVLEVMERRLQEMEGGEDGDFLLLTDCAEYLHEYANLVHHQGEDVLFDRLVGHVPSLRPPVEALRAEHEELRRTTEALREELACAESDTPCDRARLVSLLKGCLRAQRAHVEREEQELFPVVSALIAEARDLPQPPFAPHDPLLSEDTRARYRALHDHITATRA